MNVFDKINRILEDKKKTSTKMSALSAKDKAKFIKAAKERLRIQRARRRTGEEISAQDTLDVTKENPYK